MARVTLANKKAAQTRRRVTPSYERRRKAAPARRHPNVLASARLIKLVAAAGLAHCYLFPLTHLLFVFVDDANIYTSLHNSRVTLLDEDDWIARGKGNVRRCFRSFCVSPRSCCFGGERDFANPAIISHDNELRESTVFFSLTIPFSFNFRSGYAQISPMAARILVAAIYLC